MGDTRLKGRIVFTSRDVKILLAVAVSMIAGGSVWLWGAIPLVVIGVLLLIAAFSIDF